MVGIFCGWALFQSFVNHAGWQVSPPVFAMILAGVIVGPTALSLTGLPQRLGGPSADLWGGGAATRAAVAAAFYACLSIAWGMAIISFFGTKPPGT